MQLGGVSRSARAVFAAFFGVAILSSGLLGALGWKLLQQDRDLQKTRTEERIAQAGYGLAEWVRRAAGASQPSGAILIAIDGSQLSVESGTLVYYPQDAVRQPEAPPELFEEGERLEYQVRDPVAAAHAYRALSASTDAAVRAGALGRLARVQRNSGAVDDALSTYGLLEQIDAPVTVDGFPPTLFARLGRASALQTAKRTDALRREAHALEADLARGRWPLSRAQLIARRAEADSWLGARTFDNAEGFAQAEAVEWLWQNRDRLTSFADTARAVDVSDGQALLAWTRDGEHLRAGVAGPQYLATVVTNVGVEASERHRLLATALVVVGLVLTAGWYFILRAVAREQRTAQLQTDFVAAVSHEFRSPLTSMAHIAEMLETDRIPSSDTRRTAYGVLVRDTKRLRRLVEDLLDFRRLESGTPTLHLAPVDLVALVRAVVADFQTRVASAACTIELSEPAAPIRIAADADALARALGNLLDNALKYSPGCPTIWVDVTCEPERVAVSVRDRGIGIPLGEQSRIFDRFVRGAQPRTMRIKGTGIGLAIVRHIVRAHGGEVRVESEPGKGSRFTIVLREGAGAAA